MGWVAVIDILRDVAALLGLSLIVAGMWLFGVPGPALIVLGILLLALAVAPALRRAHHTQEEDRQ